MDYIIREVDGLGYLSIVLDEFKNEIYRGSFHEWPHTALDAALLFVEGREVKVNNEFRS